VQEYWKASDCLEGVSVMGVRIIEGFYDGESSFGAVMICSTTMVAFGPVFDTEMHAELFIKWFEKLGLGNVRMVAVETLVNCYAQFQKLVVECDCGGLRLKADRCEFCEGEEE